MRKIISIAIVSLFVIPSLAFASWWNPISWFKTNQSIQNSIILSTTTPDATSTNIVTIDTENKSNWWNPFSWRNKIENEPIKINESTSTIKIDDVEIRNQDDTTKEIENLKREVESLKSQKINTPVVTQPVINMAKTPEPNQPIINTSTVINTNSNEGPLKGADRAKYDKLFSEKVEEAEEIIDIYDDVVDDTIDFISVVKSTMRKYPNSSLMQRSGQELLNECNNFVSISNMLISILTERKNQFSSHIESDRAPSMKILDEIDARYNTYYEKYEASKEKVDSLMEEFVLDEKAVLEDKLDQMNQDTVQSNNTSSSELSPSEISQLSSLKTEIDVLQAQYDSACTGVPLDFCTGKRAIISEKLNSLIYQYNYILGFN